MASIEVVPELDSEYGTPTAAAARAMATSAPGQPKPGTPVGAMASGKADGAPSSDVAVSTCATSTNTRGRSRQFSKAWRLARSVVSSSAPPS